MYYSLEEMQAKRQSAKTEEEKALWQRRIDNYFIRGVKTSKYNS